MALNHWLLILRSSLQQQSVDNSLPQCSNDKSKCNAGEVDGVENPLYRITMRDIEKTENIYESLDD